MLERVSEFEAGSLDLGRLCRDLRGLFVEADPHDWSIRDGFEEFWSPIDGEHELRTEAWAPPGAASDANLRRVLDEFKGWVAGVLRDEEGHAHG